MHHYALPSLLIAALFLLLGCASHPSKSQSVASDSLSSDASIRSLGLTPGGRRMMIHSFNCTPGSRPVLILAAIHGDEPTTAYCADQLLQLLRSEPSLLRDVPLAVVPVANPDGLAARTRVNGRGVDLNRNFPAGNFNTSTTRPRNNPGPLPASEIETQILIQLIEELQPRRICSIHSIGQGRQQNNYDGPAKELAERMSQYNHYPATPNIGYPTPGSFGSWAGIDLQIPVITLELPNRMPGPMAWEENREAILAFIRGN